MPVALAAHLELDDVGRRAGDQRRGTHGPQQLLAVELGTACVARRQHLLVVGELAVDQARDQVDAVQVEQDLVAGRGEDQLHGIIGVGQDPPQLVERASGDHDRSRLDRVEDVDRPHRDPVVVGGGQGQPAALEPGQDAGEDRSRLVAGCGEGRLVQRPLQDLLGEPGRRPLAGGLDRRELIRIDPLDVGGEAAAAQVKRVEALELQVNLLRARQGAHEVGEEPRRDGRGPVRLDLAGHPVGDADLEVRGGQLEAGVLGPEEDVREHGQGASAGDRPGDHGEAARQVLLHDREFHVGLSPAVRWAAAWRAICRRVPAERQAGGRPRVWGRWVE